MKIENNNDENLNHATNKENSGGACSYVYQLEDVRYGKKLHHTFYNNIVSKIKVDKGWYDIMAKICKEYYQEEPVGGSLHIVLDDYNIDDESVIWCAGYACGKGDDMGGDIANLMRMMTVNQRERLTMTNWYT